MSMEYWDKRRAETHGQRIYGEHERVVTMQPQYELFRVPD